MFGRRHVTVRAETRSELLVLGVVDDLGVVRQVAHAGTASHRGLHCLARELLGPLLLVWLNERQVPLILLDELGCRLVVGGLHEIGCCPNLQLCVLVGAQVEEVLPLCRRDNQLVPHERLEQTIGLALRHAEHLLGQDLGILVGELGRE